MTADVSCWYNTRVDSLWGADFGERVYSPPSNGQEVDAAGRRVGVVCAGD